MSVDRPRESAAAAPSVFGFQVRSDRPLRFLRHGGGREALEIVATDAWPPPPAEEPIASWTLQGGAVAASATLHAVSGGYEYRTSDAGRFLIDLERRRIEMPAVGDEFLLAQRLYGLPLVLQFVARGDLSLHAASVEIAGRAVILAAPSRHGKTTLATALHQRGHRLLSEDLVCVRTGALEVLPGPALARLRPDMHFGGAPAGMVLAGTREDRVFLGIESNRRGSGAAVPLQAVVFLREGATVGTVRVAGAAAIQDLWHLNFRLPFAGDRAAAFRQISEVAGGVGVWNLTRPLQLDSLEATMELIEKVTAG